MPTPIGNTYSIHYMKDRVRNCETVDSSLRTVEIRASSERKAVEILRKRWKTPKQVIVSVFDGDYEIPRRFWD